MVTVTDKRKCSGCTACVNACEFGALSVVYDGEGNGYPKADPEKCRNCGKCDRACPFRNESHGVPGENRSFETRFYAAQAKDKELLSQVSSGGAFQAMAAAVIAEGGVVYGAAQEEVDRIFHIRAENAGELERTRRSKYLQSEIGECFRSARKDLAEGRTVLFSGTGCQIAGLNCFLGKRYGNLYTCEVVCHGIPSRKIWDLYRKEKEAAEGKKITALVFRDKSAGWSRNQYRITYEDGTDETERSTAQAFHAGYLRGLFYRPSCGTCPFAAMPRTADITLADYWKYRGPMAAGDGGVSLAAVNNAHGEELLRKAGDLLETEETSRESALASCRHLNSHPRENPDRNAFIRTALRDGYHAAAEKYIREGGRPAARIRNMIRHLLGR